MRYLLAVLTHGDNADVLERTIRSFDLHVSPPPNSRLVVQDGTCPLPPFAPYAWECITLQHQSGFCEATRRLWEEAASTPDIDFVFWLEHDFEFLRTVDLCLFATLLDEEPNLAQVALMREPVNQQEIDAGGVIAKHEARGDVFVERTHGGLSWLDHQAFFTTNPSLMTRTFMAENPWPDNRSECEGVMGIELRHKGFHYAFAGKGEPWVSHHGTRSGFGY